MDQNGDCEESHHTTLFHCAGNKEQKLLFFLPTSNKEKEFFHLRRISGPVDLTRLQVVFMPHFIELVFAPIHIFNYNPQGKHSHVNAM